MISWRMAAAWVAALVVTTVLTWQIVGLADSQVGETPEAIAPPFATSSTVESIMTTTSRGTTTSTARSGTTTPGTSTSSSVRSSPTSSSPVTTTSTTGELEWSLRTVNSIGGSVVVRYRSSEVELQAATPAPGFGVEVEDSGPDRVRVDFEAAEANARIEVRWKDGDLEVVIDEND